MKTTDPVRRYRRQLRKSLPKDAFRPEPRRILLLVLHGTIIAGGVAAIRTCDSIGLWLAVTVVSGHSMACLGFLAHELSHNAIVRRPALRYALELLSWSLMLVPVTVWRTVHNDSHHHGANTPEDPDRKLARDEMTPADRWYFRLFFPHAGNSLINPLVGTEFIPYILRVTLALLFFDRGRMPTLPAALKTNPRLKRRICLELVFIVLLQLAVLAWLDGSILRLFFATLLPVGIGSCVAMMYLFTNHALRPHQDHDDPLASSTSVIVPRWMDWLHSHFSYHAEHHLFPNLRSRHLPALSREIREAYPELHHRIPLTEAWRSLLSGTPHQ